MARLAFKQCDIERALRAGLAAGVPVAVRIERLTGDLVIGPAGAMTPPPAPAPEPEAGDYWETLDAAHG